MADIGSFISSAIPSGGSAKFIMLIIVIGFVAFVLLGLFSLLYFSKKKYNIRVEAKIPRSNGGLDSEYCKGFYNEKTSCYVFKRGGIMSKPIIVPCRNPGRYLQGGNVITTIQLSPVDWRIVEPRSFTNREIMVKQEEDEEYQSEEEVEVEEEVEEDGKVVKKKVMKMMPCTKTRTITKEVPYIDCILDWEVDDDYDKSWRLNTEKELKVYSLSSFYENHKDAINLAIILMSIFIGFVAIFTQIK